MRKNKPKRKAVRASLPAVVPAAPQLPMGHMPFRSMQVHLVAHLYSAFTPEKLGKLGAALLDAAIAGDVIARNEVLRLIKDMDAVGLDNRLQDVSEGKKVAEGEIPWATLKEANPWK